jgi:two-component system response regulator (stage 0 sporulation protein F)
MIERLSSGGIPVAVVDDLPAAALAASRTPSILPCILLDLRGLVVGGDLDGIRRAAESIRKTIAAIPHTMPIAVTGEADAQTVLACIRAGAGDVIDIKLEGTANARAVVMRVFQRQLAGTAGGQTASTLRSMIEDLLKDLIRTERRSIDLEEKLAQFESMSGESQSPLDGRPPSILVIEHEKDIANQLSEKLEAAGVSTYTFAAGEDAAREVATLSAKGAAFDLALVAAQLPGIDGLETVRRLRDQIAGLPAFLMTSVQDGDLAARAADLGVVGFVLKPFLDIDDMVARLAQLAHESLERTREQVYLQRIKARHERVLARYRTLPREP